MRRENTPYDRRGIAMNNELSIKYLSQEDLLRAGCFDMESAVSVVENVLTAYEGGRVLYPDKTVQIFDEALQSRINILPATLLDEKICGAKWISVFPGNPHTFGLQNQSAVILLSSIETGYPIALLEAMLCSNIRTAAVSAVAAKYLARRDSREIGFIGAGEMARMHFVALKTVLPELRVCRISSRTEETERGFLEHIAPLYPDVEFISCRGDYEKAVTGADVIVTAISGQEPLLHGAWCKKGAFYTHVGGWEDDDETVYKADKIVCDNWYHLKHRGSPTLTRLYQAGKLHDADIHGDLGLVVTGDLPGRESDDEFIYFNAVGLSYVDVALGYDFYKKAESFAAVLPLQRSGIFDHSLESAGRPGAFRLRES